LIAAVDGKLKLLLVFLFSQGWRITDVLRLTWRDVDLSDASIRYHISKTDEWATVPLHLAVLDMLRTEEPGVGYIFPWRDRTNAYRALKPLCQKIGIYFTPHMGASWGDDRLAASFYVATRHPATGLCHDVANSDARTTASDAGVSVAARRGNHRAAEAYAAEKQR
jgi:integrase